MRFTIALPVYNGARTLPRSLASCLGQRRQTADWEVLVINNASTDDSAAVLASIDDPRLRVVAFDELVDMWGNHNRALEHARGEYVLFCHADDQLLPHALDALDARVLQRHDPERLVLWGRSMFRDFARSWQGGGGELDRPLAGEAAFFPFVHAGLTPSGTLYSRQAFLDAGGFLRCDMGAANSDMTSMVSLALAGFTFEMASFMIFERRGASTATRQSVATIHKTERSAWRAFAARHDLETIRRLGLQTLEHLRAPQLTALERFILEEGLFSRGELLRLAVRRANMRTALHGELRTVLGKLARTEAPQRTR